VVGSVDKCVCARETERARARVLTHVCMCVHVCVYERENRFKLCTFASVFVCE